MCTPAPVSALIRAFGGKHRGNANARDVTLTSHVLMMLSEKGPASTMIPMPIDESVHVVFARAPKDATKKVMQTFFKVRRETIRELTEFFMTNILAFKDILSVDENYIKNLKDTEELDELVTPPNDTTDSLFDGVDESRDRPGIIDIGDGIFETSTALFESASGRCQTRQSENVSVNTDDKGKQSLRVTNASSCTPDWDPISMLLAFLALFPFGCGALVDPNRPVDVPVAQGIRHLLRLSTRQFAQNSEFLMYCFDLLARKSSQGLLSVYMKRDPSVAEWAVKVSKDDLIALVEFQQEQRKALVASQAPPPTPPNLKNAERVLGCVTAANKHSLPLFSLCCFNNVFGFFNL
jgi:hypothetical protein